MIYYLLRHTLKWDIFYLASYALLLIVVYLSSGIITKVGWNFDYISEVLMPYHIFPACLWPAIAYSLYCFVNSEVKGWANKMAEFTLYFINYFLLWGGAYVTLFILIGISIEVTGVY